MFTTSNRGGQIHPALAVALGAVAVAGLVAAVLVSRPGPAAGPAPSDRPSASPSAAPSADPTADPTPVTTPKPTATPSAAPSSPSGVGSPIDLDNATDHDVVLQVHDQTGTLTGVVSGRPGDGMSAQWHRAIVQNVDIDTISITWAGLPQDDVLDLGVAVVDGELVVTIVQSGPVPNSDAMGEDRVVKLTFDHPVSAEDVDVQVLDRTID